METLSLQATNKAIRSHGKMEGERDVTCLRKKVHPTAQDEHAGCSASAGHVLEENTEFGAGAGNAVSKSTAAGASETAEEYIEPDWSALGRPHEAPWPLTILFVGVDNGDKSQPDLTLKLEFEKIEQAYRESKVYHHVDTRRVVIKQLLFSQWPEVMMEIRKEMPTALHFGCHAWK